MSDLILSRDVSLEKTLLDFLSSDSYVPASNIKEWYASFLAWLPKGIDRPSFNAILNIKQLLDTQHQVDFNQRSLELLRAKIRILDERLESGLATEDEKKECRQLKSMEAQRELRWRELVNMLLKHTNQGLDRETPRKQEITINRKPDLREIHRIILEKQKSKAQDAVFESSETKTIDAELKQ